MKEMKVRSGDKTQSSIQGKTIIFKESIFKTFLPKTPESKERMARRRDLQYIQFKGLTSKHKRNT